MWLLVDTYHELVSVVDFDSWICYAITNMADWTGLQVEFSVFRAVSDVIVVLTLFYDIQVILSTKVVGQCSSQALKQDSTLRQYLNSEAGVFTVIHSIVCAHCTITYICIWNNLWRTSVLVHKCVIVFLLLGSLPRSRSIPCTGAFSIPTLASCDVTANIYQIFVQAWIERTSLSGNSCASHDCL